MKSSALITLVMLFSGILSFNTSYAQGKVQPGGLSNADRAAQLTAELNQKLAFSKEQTASITKLHLNFLNNMEETRNDFDNKNAKSKLKVLDKIKKLNQDKEEAIKKLLKPDQLAVYETYLEEIKTVRKETFEAKPKPEGQKVKPVDNSKTTEFK